MCCYICRSQHRGFSMVELMVTLTVAAILLGVGVPGFAGLIRNQRMAAAVGDFQAALHLARAEAIGRGTRVDVVPADGKDWAKGWIVFVDDNGNLRPDAKETVIFSHGPVADKMAITSSLTDNAVPYVAYAASGRTRTNHSEQQPQSGTISFALDKQVRKIKLNFLGRARTCNPVEEPQAC